LGAALGLGRELRGDVIAVEELGMPAGL